MRDLSAIEWHLMKASSRFRELEADSDLTSLETYHSVGAAIEALCVALIGAETSGISRLRMRELVTEARDCHACSPFVERLQTWPEGYPGDYLTIEHLMSQVNRAAAGTLGYWIEQYCLGTRIAQQHRNKVQHQALEILRVILAGLGRAVPKILVLAAGSSPDLRYIKDLVAPLEFQVVINDSDPEAIDFSLKELAQIREKVVPLEGNAIRCADEIRELGPYDLVVAGGLFDYLNANWANQFVALVMGQWLAPGGKFFFTNIATGNPYRLWMECVTDWEVVERSERDLVDLVTHATARGVSVHVAREATSLTLLAHARRVE